MVWDRMDAQDRTDAEHSLADRIAELEDRCRRRGLPIPDVPPNPNVASRHHENHLMDRVSALEEALRQHARDPFAGRSASGETAELKKEVAELEAELAARGVTPPPFTPNPRFFGHTERMAWKRRRDALWALLMEAEGEGEE